jgi:hypothetical protein
MNDGSSTRIEPVVALGDAQHELTIARSTRRQRRHPEPDADDKLAVEEDEETDHRLDELG